jgi:molybdopterin-guanine dinucleotide biosynthesis protein A
MVGVVLAGGAAQRMGGDKAGALLEGRTLLAWTVAALRAAGLREVAVAAKAGAVLPAVDATVWEEPAEPRHPLAGIAAALARAGGRDIVTLPVDLPLVPAAVLRALAAAPLGDAPAAVVRAGGRLQPLVGRFTSRAQLAAEGRASDAILALAPLILDVPGDGFLNINAPADLAAAGALVRSSSAGAAGR